MARHTHTVIELRAGSLSESDLSVRRITGREALSHPFAFDAEFFPTSGDPLDLPGLGGADALLTLRRPDGTERYVHGILWAVELTGVERGAPRYRARIAPKLTRLAHVRRSRVFQSMSVPEIVKKVLDDAGVANRTSLSGSYPKREYCLQYRESDLDFVSRLLEDEGIFYWFEHASDAHTLVLADARGGCTDVAGDPIIPFRVREHADSSEDEHVFRLVHAHRVRPGKVALEDYDFERPEMQNAASAEAPGDALGLEQYLYPGGFRTPSAGSPIARIRLEEQRVASDTFAGESTCVRFQPGAMFELSGHPDPSFDRKLLLVSAVHEGEQQEAAGGVTGIHHGYRNAVLAVDSESPYRPLRRTRRPLAYTETATVVGPPGEEIHVDAHGRVKVQFNWDRAGAKDDKSSCFVRLGQSWAGAAWGASFVPRIGQEVLVRFLEGNPDAPLVVGAVYNGANPPPISLPGEKTKSTVRTDSSLGGGGSNELLLEDATAAEEIYLHAQKDENVVIENDKAQQVVRDEALEVAKDRTQEVTGNQALRVGLADAREVIGSQSLAVMGNRTSSVTQSHAESVSASQTVTVGRTETVDVGARCNVIVGAAAVLNVGGAFAVNVGAVHNTAVAGARLEQIGGAHLVGVGAAREIRVAKDASDKVGGDDTATIGGSAAHDAKDRQENVGKKAQLIVADKVTVLANKLDLSAKEFTLRVGGKQILHAKSDGQVQLAGSTVTIDASGTATFKGAQVKKTAGSAPASASASKETLEKAKPAAAKASWSKGTVLPLHEDANGAIPADCDVTPDVQVTNVPEGTKAQISIHHCASGAMVKGGRIDCKVQGGKLVDAKTGKPPAFRFGAAQMPWDPYDKPFFFFKASVKHQGLTVETPIEMKDGGKSLKVKYLHFCVGDHWADVHPPHLDTAGDAANVAGILAAVTDSVAEVRLMSAPNPTLAMWSYNLDGAYCYHQSSHGVCADRTNPATFIDTDPPPQGSGDPPECPVGNWRSVIVLAKQAPFRYLLLGDEEVRDKTRFPSVPRYLVYLDCCLAGWEPSLARAFVARGTRYVIGFRRTVGAATAKAMATEFHTKWAKDKLDPDKIRDIFFEVGSKYYSDLRPVIVGWRYEEILSPTASAIEKAVSAVGSVLGGVVSSIGELFK
jgi:type VI secretion system secreted protein VgrG